MATTSPDQNAIDNLFAGAATAPSPASASAAPAEPAVSPVSFPDLGSAGLADPSVPGAVSISMIRALRMPVSVVLGRTRMRIDEIMALGRGSVVVLNRLTGEPVEFMVGDVLLAKGEVVVANEHYAIRINEILAEAQDLVASGTK